ncbi:hypothetical protein JZ751_006779 [Albula glossodonta]|uniref:Uncharacterized protein n=1 Tax=Albula glossodonta TaxID=121402 RepID=A0A8T2PAC3_9TELE|nr:hypothetical protein JZ751_006779 [Albula glossodonta]
MLFDYESEIRTWSSASSLIAKWIRTCSACCVCIASRSASAVISTVAFGTLSSAGEETSGSASASSRSAHFFELLFLLHLLLRRLGLFLNKVVVPSSSSIPWLKSKTPGSCLLSLSPTCVRAQDGACMGPQAQDGICMGPQAQQSSITLVRFSGAPAIALGSSSSMVTRPCKKLLSRKPMGASPSKRDSGFASTRCSDTAKPAMSRGKGRLGRQPV